MLQVELCVCFDSSQLLGSHRCMLLIGCTLGGQTPAQQGAAACSGGVCGVCHPQGLGVVTAHSDGDSRALSCLPRPRQAALMGPSASLGGVKSAGHLNVDIRERGDLMFVMFYNQLLLRL